MLRFCEYLAWIVLASLCCWLSVANGVEEEKYLCKNECAANRTRCGCTTECIEDGNCCSDYHESCRGEKGWVDMECIEEGEWQCPQGFKHPPVILFSIDGFKAEYLYREKTPYIWKLGMNSSR